MTVTSNNEIFRGYSELAKRKGADTKEYGWIDRTPTQDTYGIKLLQYDDGKLIIAAVF